MILTTTEPNSNGPPKNPLSFTINVYIILFAGISSFIPNGVLLVVFAVVPLRCLRNVSTWLIVNLSLADLMTAAAITIWASSMWGWLSPKTASLVASIAWMGYMVSFLTIALLSLERYVVIKYMWSADAIVTKNRTLVAILAIWLWSGNAFFFTKEENRKIFIIALSSVMEVCIILVVVFYYKLWSLRRKQMQQAEALSKEETGPTVVVCIISLTLIATTMPLLASYQVI